MIAFRCEEMTDQGLIYLADFFQKLKTLQDIRLNFTKYFFQEFSEISSFSCHQLTDQGLLILRESFKGQQCLKNLSLDLEGYNIMNDIS